MKQTQFAHEGNPYTYLLRFKPTGQLYYGARWKKGCHPNELGVKYFSSSKSVTNLIERYGIESFEFEVRAVFASAGAIQCEARVHRKFNVSNDPRWLNRHRAGDKFYNIGRKGSVFSQKHCRAISDSLTGVKKSPEHIEKMAASKRGKPQSEEHIRKRVEKNKGQRWSPEKKKLLQERMSGTRIYICNKTGITKRFIDAPNDGWSHYECRTKIYITPWGSFHNLKTAVAHPNALFRTKNVVAKKCRSAEVGYSVVR